ncbi:hypothetical protein N8Z27_03240 [Crocinitomicaceae bacterium]|nr:hypothetical protein [Crocinitomicaceae bacterium]MDC1283177.1 hypothetical protein [Crocinitomicaceae bacterium]MDC1385019.1 hypothetical protein [Crocinitomicaceae bacterium]|tara:strand:+ start:108247 stop:108621 length:375 start_codon:yes stop_codon:yes gene_type:complete
MKILKYALVGMVLLGGVNANAQNNTTLRSQAAVSATKTPAEKAASQTAEMTSALSLTPEQVVKVESLNLRVAKKIEVIETNATFSAAKKTEFINGNKKDHKSVMKMILSEEQLVTYEAWLSNQN